MALTFYSLLEAALLVLNGIAVLNRDRFLKKVGFGQTTQSFDDPSGQSIKDKIFTLIFAVQTVMRVPLIGINIVVIIFKLILG
ncbi:unnamed protein product, partial [Mesorhabditis belari]|uniref:Immediate early response 3-interacting protein 1 n=1 Tax=Mesorhabditis belari TaxID=2138241 RepID=A0A915GKE3_9BILA